MKPPLFIADLVHGLTAPLQAARFLRAHPALLRYVAIPFVINVLTFALVFYFGAGLFDELTARYLSGHEGWWWQVLDWLVTLLAALVTLVLVFFSFTLVGNLIAAPFNELLSERTEQLLSGAEADTPFALRRLLRDAGRSLFDEVRKLSLFVIALVLCLSLALIPFLGAPLSAAGSLLLTLYFLVIEYTGFVFGRKALGFAVQRRFVARRRGLWLGFALAVFALLLVPLIQLLTIPLAVVAATLLCSGLPLQHPPAH